jgi:5-methylcytosine-specific restriction endonuclease McrA
MRPLLRPDPSPWRRPATLKFGGNAKPPIQTYFHTDEPDTDDCLELWDLEAAGSSLTKEQAAAIPAIKAKVATEYKTATAALLDAFGGFCVYCELALDDPTQLEHAVPKGPYPTFALTWENFLPACIGCNSRKLNQPPRAYLLGQLPATPPPTPDDFRDAIRQRMYRWPDLDDTLGYFEIHLFWRDAADAWQQVPDADAVAPGTVRCGTTVVGGTVRADLPTLGLDGVPVVALTTSANQPDGRATAMIEMCQLDRQPEPRDASDRRWLYRTEAWLRAVKLLTRISASPPRALDDAVVELILNGGFACTWITVAGLLSPGLRQLVVDVVKTMPGTDAARLL